MFTILRAFQVIKRDGVYDVAYTYNVADEHGNITKANARDNFIAVDAALTDHIAAIEQYIMENRIQC